MLSKLLLYEEQVMGIQLIIQSVNLLLHEVPSTMYEVRGPFGRGTGNLHFNSILMI